MLDVRLLPTTTEAQCEKNMQALILSALLLLVACRHRRPTSTPEPSANSRPADSLAYETITVDRAAQPIDIPKPRYPPDLRSSGRCGYADLKYIVGVDDRAEP